MNSQEDKGVRDIPEQPSSQSSKAHVVHPSPKEAPDWKHRQPKGEDVIDTALMDMYQLGIQLEQQKPGAHRGICFNNKAEAKAIAQHIAEQVEAAWQRGYNVGYSDKDGDDLIDIGLFDKEQI